MMKAFAVKPLVGSLSVEIVRFEYGNPDYVHWRFSNEKKIHKNIIYTTKSGRSYFKNNGKRHYIDEFMRV